eukprot:scaffold99932_cov28-Tisochrysis_lutea.AAC.1
MCAAASCRAERIKQHWSAAAHLEHSRTKAEPKQQAHGVATTSINAVINEAASQLARLPPIPPRIHEWRRYKLSVMDVVDAVKEDARAVVRVRHLRVEHVPHERLLPPHGRHQIEPEPADRRRPVKATLHCASGAACLVHVLKWWIRVRSEGRVVDQRQTARFAGHSVAARVEQVRAPRELHGETGSDVGVGVGTDISVGCGAACEEFCVFTHDCLELLVSRLPK